MPPPSSLPPTAGLHHVALKTRDWDRSAAFYQDVLGLTLKISWTMPNGETWEFFQNERT